MNCAAVISTECGCGDVPLIAYVLSTAAATSAGATVIAWPWFVPIAAVVIAHVIAGPSSGVTGASTPGAASTGGWLVAASGVVPSSSLHALSTETPTTPTPRPASERRNWMRVIMAPL